MDWSDEPMLDASSGLDDIFMGNYAYYQNLYFWSDEKIQGKNYTLRLNMTYIPDYKTSIQDETFINRKQYKVYLYSLSEEFYRYLKSLNEQKNNELGNVRWLEESTELTGRKVGIIGLGKTGGMIAEAMRFFGAEVLYYSRTRKAEAEAKGIAYRPLADLLKEAEIVCTCLPRNN